MGRFRDQLSALIADDKKDAATSIFDALDKQLSDYDTDIRALKTEMRQKDGIKPEDFAKLEKEREELRAQLSETEKALKTTTKERDVAQAKAAAETTAAERNIIDGGIAKALASAGYKPEQLPAISARIRELGILAVSGEGMSRKAIAKLKKDGKESELSLEDYITKEFATSIEGKAWLPAGGDSGAGAGGSGGSGAAGKKWAEMSLKDQSDLYKRDPTLAKQLQAAK